MNIIDLGNLYIGYNEQEKFRILICASDEKEAQEIADDYAKDTGLKGSFMITEPESDLSEIRFDCDTILCKEQESEMSNDCKGNNSLDSIHSLTNLLYNAIVGWYDNALESYNGIDDEDFIKLVCDCTGMSVGEYRKVMGINSDTEYKLYIKYYPFDESDESSPANEIEQSQKFVNEKEAIKNLNEMVEKDLTFLNNEREKVPVEDSDGNIVGYDFPFRADYDEDDGCIIRFWDGDDYRPVATYNIKDK